uniref:methyl-accepting chemotaxis protein n=1 Tax=Azorhizobium sp. AG788 TaxID=2183897 RepID=UPI00313980C5
QAIQQLDKVIQQNAGASEQMSATSEELAAQAEQLQASIAYFRIDGAGASAGPARMPSARTTGPKPSARGGTQVRKPAVVTSVRAAQPRAAAGANGRNAGMVLDLGGGDARDAEFERY